MSITEGNTAVETLATIAQAAAKKLLYDVIIKAVINKIVTAIPFFGLGFINPILVFVVTKLADILYDEAAVYGAFMMIDFKENQKRQAYDHATLKIKQLIEGSENDPAKIQAAKDEYKKRLSDLIRFPAPVHS